MQHSDLAYYAARAAEYERIYAKPERQADLATLRSTVPVLFRDQAVLEVACGTGYWTQYLAQSARRVCATDLSVATLAVARAKGLDGNRVRFMTADALALPEELGQYDAAFCGFWWSHIPRAAIAGFLDSLHARLSPGARVVLLDNRYVAASSTPISRTSPAGDTFQMRRLADGSSHEVLKNFPTEGELQAQLRARAQNIKYTALQYYWYLEYQVA